MWPSTGESAPGAFDGAADFERHDIVGLARARGARPWGSAAAARIRSAAPTRCSRTRSGSGCGGHDTRHSLR